MPRVFIIILNWNQLKDTGECLASLRKLNYSNYHVIVVDNASTDGSADFIAQEYPGVILVRNQENIGFVGGNNNGIKLALESGADYVFILNNDTIVDPNMLSRLVEISESDKTIAVVGPQMFYHDEPDKLWFLTAKVEWPSANIKILNQNERKPYSDGLILDTDYVAGAGMFIRANVIRSLGMFDPYFFIYWEDVELCTRFLRAGYKIKSATNAYMWHKVSSAATKGYVSYFLMGRNQLYFCRKYNNSLVFWFKVVPFLLYSWLRNVIYTRFNNNSIALAFGMLAYFRGYSGKKGISGV